MSEKRDLGKITYFDPNNFPSIEEILSLYLYCDKLRIIPPVDFIFTELFLDPKLYPEVLDISADAYNKAIKFESNLKNVNHFNFVSPHSQLGYRLLVRTSYNWWDHSIVNDTEGFKEYSRLKSKIPDKEMAETIFNNDRFPILKRQRSDKAEDNPYGLMKFSASFIGSILNRSSDFDVIYKKSKEFSLIPDIVAIELLKTKIPTIIINNPVILNELKEESRKSIYSFKKFVRERTTEIIKIQKTLSPKSKLNEYPEISRIVKQVGEYCDDLKSEFDVKIIKIKSKKTELKNKLTISLLGGIALGIVTNPFVSAITSIMSIGAYGQELISQKEKEYMEISKSKRGPIGIFLLFQELEH